MSNDYIINLYTQRRERKRKRFFRLLLSLIIISTFIYFIFNFSVSRLQSLTEIISPIPAHPTPSVNKNQPPVSKSLEALVQKSLEETKGIYGIVIKNLNSNETYYSMEHKIFEAGSLYKLWVLAESIKQIQQGLIKEDEVLSEDVTVLNNDFSIDPDLAELKSGTITLTVDQALTQMITISHNYAALLLTKRIKLSSVKQFLQDNNLHESIVGTNGESPTTTPYDVALFFEKLYKGNLANVELTQKMLNLLKKQQLNNKLAKYLPEEVSVAHKTGEIGWFSHDGGIIFANNGDYIIVVLSETESPKGAEDRIANLSKAVFDYFNK